MNSATPVRTYEVSVDGYSEVNYSARSPAKARARAWRDYSSMYECSFHRFLCMSRIRAVPNPPGIGQRIMVAGLPATRCLGGQGHYVYFMRDESDAILCAHPADVTGDIEGTR